MKVSVTEDQVKITENAKINAGEYGVTKCEFDLPECFNGLTVTASFNCIPVPLMNNVCYVPSLPKGTFNLGVYAYKENNGILELMYSPAPTMFSVGAGSFSGNVNDSGVPELSEYEEYCIMLKNYCEEQLKDYSAVFKKMDNIEEHKDESDNCVSTKAVYDYTQKLLGTIIGDMDRVLELLKVVE